jgi:CRP-like cAMP-binding protein
MDAATERTGNLILDSTSPEERRVLLESSQTRAMNIGDIRRRMRDPVTDVMFPTSGCLSLIIESNGNPVECATVGREGAVDFFAALGSRVATHTVLTQLVGECIDVDVDAFEKVYRDGLALQPLIQGFMEAVFFSASMSAACIATHHVNERCARWLLETHDRVGSDTFYLKQEFLATMLAVRRPSVSIAAGTLQASGLITYRRGNISILDREGLEDAACSCYEAVRSEYERLVRLY